MTRIRISREAAKRRSTPAAFRKLKSEKPRPFAPPLVVVTSSHPIKTFAPSRLRVSLPSPEPKLTLQGSDLWLEFPFSEGYSAAVDSEKSGKTIPVSNPDASGKTLFPSFTRSGQANLESAGGQIIAVSDLAPGLANPSSSISL